MTLDIIILVYVDCGMPVSRKTWMRISDAAQALPSHAYLVKAIWMELCPVLRRMVVVLLSELGASPCSRLSDVEGQY